MFSLKNLDWGFFLEIVLILFLGSATILSLNSVPWLTQASYLFLAILIYFLAAGLDFSGFSSFGWIFYLASLVLLFAPLFFGVFSRGATRWLQIGEKTFQPSEIAKPLLIIFFSHYWTNKKFNLKSLATFLLLLFSPLLLIFLQPDLGSTLVVMAIVLGILLISEVSLRQILGLGLIILILAPLGWFFLKDYQKLRIRHFLDPWSDPLGAGYNLIQSITAVGSGGLMGKGLGKGTQSQLAFLPERHTDFAFASFAEEFGFLGSLALLFLYFLILRNILLISQRQKDKFAMGICLGIFSMIFFQAAVNIGMNLGILPITGITLPLFSYGGSSLVSTMFCLGLVNSLSKSLKKSSAIEIGVR